MFGSGVKKSECPVLNGTDQLVNQTFAKNIFCTTTMINYIV